MTQNPIWTLEQLVERTGDDWPIRPRIWAVEELSHRAPDRLWELAPDLLNSDVPALVEATSDRLAPNVEPSEASALLKDLEPSVQLLALMLRAGDEEGGRMARVHGRWDQWVRLDRDGFEAWFTSAPHGADADLAMCVAHQMIEGGAEFVAKVALEYADATLADQLGAYLHLSLTGMVRAFSEDAGARGVAALRSPHFAMPDDIMNAFQEIGSLPPHLPRGRFVGKLKATWDELFDQLPDDELGMDHYEFTRDVSLAAVQLDGPETSQAAIRLANRAIAAGILRVGLDNGFGENPDAAERMDIWLSFAPAAFGRANQLLLHPSLEIGEVDDSTATELAVEAFERVDDSGLTAATELAWTVLKNADDAHAHTQAIAESMLARATNDAAIEEMIASDGYAEMIALAPGAFQGVAERGLAHADKAVWTTTVHALSNSGDKAAAELLVDRFDELLRRDAAPHVARGLAVLADPDGLQKIVESWRPDEPKLASFALSAGEIVGDDIAPEIAEEGEQAFVDELSANELDFNDFEATLAKLRGQFRAIIKCRDCDRLGRYQPTKVIVDARAAERGELDGNVVANEVVTCKFCGAIDSYDVDGETSFYIYPHLAEGLSPDESRVIRARLELSDGTAIESATQALEKASKLADAGGVSEKLDLMRVSALFGQADQAARLREELAVEAPEELEAFDNQSPDLATDEEVDEVMRELGRDLSRKHRATRTRVSKVGRYGVAGCFLSDDGQSPGVGIAVMRKMPRGKFALAWIAVHRSSGEIPVAGAELGIGRTNVQNMLDGWNGAPFRPADLSEVTERLDTAIRRAVSGDMVTEEMAAVWPFFAGLLTR